MIPADMLPLTVQWLEPGAMTDAYNNSVPDWADPTVDEQIAAWIDRSDTTEQRDLRDTIVSGWLMLTNEIGITARARIVWDSRTFEIDGHPWPAMTPQGVHHLELRLRLVEG